jgi:hypothetical protein
MTEKNIEGESPEHPPVERPSTNPDPPIEQPESASDGLSAPPEPPDTPREPNT